jgi:hypothetical protein
MPVLNESLIILDNMLQDLFDDPVAKDELTGDLKALLENAQRNIASAKMLRSRQAINDSSQQAKDDLEALSKSLTVKQKWLIRHLSKNKNVDQDLVGSECGCLIDAGLIQKDNGHAVLTDAGWAMNAIWDKK